MRGRTWTAVMPPVSNQAIAEAGPPDAHFFIRRERTGKAHRGGRQIYHSSAAAPAIRNSWRPSSAGRWMEGGGAEGGHSRGNRRRCL